MERDAAETQPFVDVVILNWRGWGDTIECAESLLKSGYERMRLIICDNDSGDGSFENIIAWAEGRLDPWPGANAGTMRRYTMPPANRPVPHRVLHTRAESEQRCEQDDDARVIIIQTGANLGYAGGNNVGMRYSMAQNQADYVWVLNNDIVVPPDSLHALIERAGEERKAGRKVGLVGARLVFYFNPDKVQCRGGARFNAFLGRGADIGADSDAADPGDRAEVEARLDYVHGASTFVSMEFLHSVGLMYDGYFLFYEEIDWATRAGKNWPLLYAPDAIIYHRHGGASGASAEKGKRGALAEFYMARSRLLFTRRLKPWALPGVLAYHLAQIGNRCWRGHWKKAWLLTQLLFGKSRYP